MFLEIYATFSIVTISMVFSVLFRGLYNFFRFREKNDLYLMFLLALLTFPIILDLMRTVLLLGLPLQYWDFLFVGFSFSVLTSLVGIGVLVKLLSEYAARMKSERNSWKWWLIIIILFFFILLYSSLIHLGLLILHENGFIYRSVVILNPNLNILFLIIAEIIFLPFIIQFLQIGKKMQTLRWRKRAIQAVLFVELLFFTIYFQYALISNWETVVVNSILQFILALFVILIFLPRNQGEAMFMQLSIESIYICEKSGATYYTGFFIEGKNRDEHGQLVWGLVEATSNMVNKIRGVKRVGLGHILLEDGTAIIIEQSEKVPLYYIVFTARYTNYTHEKLKQLKKVLDGIFAQEISRERKEVNPQFLEKKINETLFGVRFPERSSYGFKGFFENIKLFFRSDTGN